MTKRDHLRKKLYERNGLRWSLTWKSKEIIFFREKCHNLKNSYGTIK